MEMSRERDLGPPSDLLARAAGELRQLTDDGWVRAEQSVLDRVARALRSARPVRGRHEGGDFFLSSTVLSARVGTRVDSIPGVRASSVRIITDDVDHLEAVTLAVSVAYGQTIADVGSRARGEAAAAASEALGVQVRTDQVTVDVLVEDVFVDEARDDSGADDAGED
ncbi:hypothetical protein IM660_00925 [Ruania alkalisoli]|uniref:Asp23/Gls24 family envelope stress response protein n=1 Tax=Ruania alkalisoli TaxID=2779775 RepID=A0A7M1STM2_9MICO|nr:hypothetical protein [Ruania alkalisoli]QOR70916.1 hypothetical protein IM660_00925 [Ruania alkalisoli]